MKSFPTIKMTEEEQQQTNIILPGIYDCKIWKPIHTFSEIEVSPNTLILCDIDDTLLHHPAINNAWVNAIYVFFTQKYYSTHGHYNRVQSEIDTNQYLDTVFNEIPMRHTDRDGFFAMIEKAADFAFVTARGSVAKEFTYSNLRSLDIDPEKYPVHFCWNMDKGEYITQHFDVSKYDCVIFIDDQPRNLENVFLLVFHDNLKLYEFQMIREKSPYDYYPVPPGFDPKLRFDGEFFQEVEINDATNLDIGLDIDLDIGDENCSFHSPELSQQDKL